VDALAIGIPCVASTVGGIPESITDGETGFLRSPQDAGGFVAQILTLLNDAALRRQIGNAGHDAAERLFAPIIQEKKLLELYQRLTQMPL
jgi:glycosyltransferase involved in cell wall biosynthesis